MRHPCLSALAALVILAPQAGCKDVKLDAARRSEREAVQHVRQAREGFERLARGYLPLLESLAPDLGAPVSAGNEDGVRMALIAANTRQTAAGSLTGYPAGFTVATDRQGRVIAKNTPAEEDRMRGTNLVAWAPLVRTALEGQGTLGAAERPADGGPSTVFLVAAVPIRHEGNVVGALVSGIAFGRLARALDQTVRLNAGQRPVLWVGLLRNGRVLPSGNDADVQERWLIPRSLVQQIPADTPARLERAGGFSWHFIESGQRGWGAALGRIWQLSDTSIVVFRSEAEQR